MANKHHDEKTGKFQHLHMVKGFKINEPSPMQPPWASAMAEHLRRTEAQKPVEATSAPAVAAAVPVAAEATTTRAKSKR